MAKKKTYSNEPKPAQLTPAQIKAAISKLERRLQDVEAFIPEQVKDECDSSASALQKKIESTLVEVFGSDTLEYKRYQMRDLYLGPLVLGGVSLSRAIEGYRDGKEKAMSNLKTAIEMLKEKLEDFGVAIDNAMPSTLEGLNFHPNIISAAGPLYRDGHYANAVETACKVLNNLVQNSEVAPIGWTGWRRY